MTFNYRYSPPRTQIKELLDAGVIGEVLSVDFHWLLNTHHGADYYRRWHRNKAQFSGGLMVHKATHHFDLVNWWLSAVPVEVFASRQQKVLHPTNGRPLRADPARRALPGLRRSRAAAHSTWTSARSKLKEMYLDNECVRRLLPRPLRLQRRKSTSETR